ncbi:hypothetical protein ACX80V_16770 [Arthrobacter sp. MDT3-24]
MDSWLSVLTDATLKAVPTFAAGLILLVLGWVFTSRVTAFWDQRRKKRELGLIALERLYELYGEFFAVWKLWEELLPRLGPVGSLTPDEAKERAELLRRAAAVEGAYESLMVKLIVERRLGTQDLKNLAYFREGLQCLRESIEANKRLKTRHGNGDEWRSASQTDKPQRAQAYLSFKTLAVLVSEMATYSKPAKRGRRWLRGHQKFGRVKAEELMAATTAQARYTWWHQGLHQPLGGAKTRGNRGLRLAAYAYLHTHPVPALTPLLAQSAVNEVKPFGQYCVLRALRRQVSFDPDSLDLNTRRRLQELLIMVGPGTDRGYELSQILRLVPPKAVSRQGRNRGL